MCLRTAPTPVQCGSRVPGTIAADGADSGPLKMSSRAVALEPGLKFLTVAGHGPAVIIEVHMRMEELILFVTVRSCQGFAEVRMENWTSRDLEFCQRAVAPLAGMVLDAHL